MHKRYKTIIGASVLTAGLLAAPVILYAHEDNSGTMSSGSGNVMGNGSMMDQGSGDMMDGQGGMMNMMGQMGRMAQNCNAMMTSMMSSHGAAPNRQWKQDAPSAAPNHRDQSE